jgi:hypothetical protein
MHSMRTTIFKGCLKTGAGGGASAAQPLVDAYKQTIPLCTKEGSCTPHGSPIETAYCVETSVAWKPMLRGNQCCVENSVA